jgi:hypothetical protein
MSPPDRDAAANEPREVRCRLDQLQRDWIVRRLDSSETRQIEIPREVNVDPGP